MRHRGARESGAVHIGEHKGQKIIHVRIDEVQQDGIVRGNDITGEEKKGNDDY